ncbi:AMP-binding protein [Bacillus sp. Marseille-P3661]|uniref:AMP-binding protein n=1 Tax=Bacillus sp. Marseille-P3661 TaxID=1936234 RepID=UPI000C82C249|nr:AMP-binding protein [Bacillus sp. Marseille-P3661]
MAISRQDLSETVWYPSTEQIQQANITNFIEKYGLVNYQTLIRKSAADPNWFFSTYLREIQINWYENYEKVMDYSKGIAHTEWFKNGKLNLYSNCIEKHLHRDSADVPAIIWEGEDGRQRTLSYTEVDHEVNRIAAYLIQLGVKKGTCIGMYLPPLPEVAITIFACAKIGAIVVPIFSGYGADAIASRLVDCNAKILITADEYYRKGKKIPMRKTAQEAVKFTPSVNYTIVIPHLNSDISLNNNELLWDSYQSSLSVDTEVMDTNDPFMIVYTSGTTGKPKGTVHTHGGFPIKITLDMYFCFDIKPRDRIFWLTDMGWVMGPWLFLGASFFGATVVLYEGSLDYPNPDRLWKLTADHKINIFGTAPTAIRTLMLKGDEWVQKHDLSSLRILGSTGEPWDALSWRWFLEVVGQRKLPIINFSGGTEVSGGIIGCFPIFPFKPGCFHGPLPSLAVDVFDTSGQSIRGETGELVLTKPSLGMTRSFWNDTRRYFDTYWSIWEDVWAHGDQVKIDTDGFWYVIGRSDDTLKVAGKRIGPSEIESLLTDHKEIELAAVVGIPDVIKGHVPVAFVVVSDGIQVDDSYLNKWKSKIEYKLGKSFCPKEIHIVEKLPTTQSNKVIRKVIKAAYLNLPVGDVSTIANIDAIEPIRKLANAIG